MRRGPQVVVISARPASLVIQRRIRILMLALQFVWLQRLDNYLFQLEL